MTKTIIRVQREKGEFFIGNKNYVNEPELSMKAKGIHTYAMSKPDDWEFNITDIANHCKDGRDAIRSGILELEKAGYWHREISRDDKGRIEKHIWVVHEIPLIEATRTGKSRYGQSINGKTPSGKSNTTKNKDTKNKDTKNKSSRKRDPRLDHPAYLAYRNWVKYHIPYALRDTVINTVGENTSDIDMWDETVKLWVSKGYNPRNIDGMLKVFKNGWEYEGRKRPSQFDQTQSTLQQMMNESE